LLKSAQTFLIDLFKRYFSHLKDSFNVSFIHLKFFLSFKISIRLQIKY
jgi:hypothetical protein